MDIIYEIQWYGIWWAPFVLGAFGAGYFLRLAGVFIATVVISLVIVRMDVLWIFDELRHHPENGRDADFIFWFGVLVRLVVFNGLLIPIGLIGWRFGVVQRRAKTTKPSSKG